MNMNMNHSFIIYIHTYIHIVMLVNGNTNVYMYCLKQIDKIVNPFACVQQVTRQQTDPCRQKNAHLFIPLFSTCFLQSSTYASSRSGISYTTQTGTRCYYYHPAFLPGAGPALRMSVSSLQTF